MSKLEENTKSNINYFQSRQSLLNCIKITEDQAKSAKHIIDVLISRHNYLSRVEEFIANNPVLLPYYAQAQEEVTSAQNYSMSAIFIVALEKISDVLLEYEK